MNGSTMTPEPLGTDAPDAQAQTRASGVFVIVRAAGERTEAAARALAAAQVGEDKVALIREVPFAAAVRRGFEIGVEAGEPWTLCLDADVLLRPGAIEALRRAGEAALEEEPALFEVEGDVADKLFGQLRQAGQHLYRTALLPKALEEVRFDAKRSRPEATVKDDMERLGHPSARLDVLTGLHDFEQSYADLFRKVFVHTRKHARYMAYASRYWRRLGAQDDDYRFMFVAMQAASAINDFAGLAGMNHGEKVSIDKRGFSEDVTALLRPMGLDEKPPLRDGDVTGAAVEAALAAFEVSPEYLRSVQWRETMPPGASWTIGRRVRVKAFETLLRIEGLRAST